MTVETTHTEQSQQNIAAESHLKQMALIGYILYAVSLLIPFAIFGTLILAYIKRGEAKGTWVESHFRWQIRTFWVMVIATIISIILLFVLIGYFTAIAAGIWFIYRVIRGWLALSNDQPVGKTV
jgi:uncharacterized membrane protein